MTVVSEDFFIELEASPKNFLRFNISSISIFGWLQLIFQSLILFEPSKRTHFDYYSGNLIVRIFLLGFGTSTSIIIIQTVDLLWCLAVLINLKNRWIYLRKLQIHHLLAFFVLYFWIFFLINLKRFFSLELLQVFKWIE